MRARELELLAELAQHDRGRGHRERAADARSRPPASTPSAQRDAAERAAARAAPAGRRCRTPRTSSRPCGQRELEPEREHQEHDAEFGEQLRIVSSSSSTAERVRPEQHADDAGSRGSAAARSGARGSAPAASPRAGPGSASGIRPPSSLTTGLRADASIRDACSRRFADAGRAMALRRRIRAARWPAPRLRGDCRMADLRRSSGAAPMARAGAACAIDLTARGRVRHRSGVAASRGAATRRAPAAARSRSKASRPRHFAYLRRAPERRAPAAAAPPTERWLIALRRTIETRLREHRSTALGFGGRIARHGGRRPGAACGGCGLPSVVRHVYETGVRPMPVVALIAFLISVISPTSARSSCARSAPRSSRSTSWRSACCASSACC